MSDNRHMVTVACPACQTRYNARVQALIDVGSEPRLKDLLLQGRLNIGVCPSCGTAGMLSVPLTYHDPDKELLLCLVPQELHINETQRQRTIGEMSNAIINSLPPEQRKGYLLRPRVFLTLQSLVEAVLEADGITKEMLEAQQDKLDLIARMLQTLEDPMQLSALIGEHKDRIDHELFALLGLQINAADSTQQPDLADRLGRLRQQLMDRTEVGAELAREEAALSNALVGMEDGEFSRQDLLARIIETEPRYQDQVLNVLIALARPLIDYQFFQLFTARIDSAADEAEKTRLKGLRQRILEVTQEMDAEALQQTQERVALLQEIVSSETPADRVRAHIDQIDDTFMAVLAAAIAQNQEDSPEFAERLLRVRNTILEVLRESAPPELRFVSQLLEADYPDGTRQLLTDNRTMVTPQLLGVMEALASELSDRGNDEVGEKLSGILAQAKLMA
ncbi:MAG: CpXC domain-containing protein [Anaerolineae bacterium]|nr:CpXC domain-containing protein [Anaerolineae bacterium]